MSSPDTVFNFGPGMHTRRTGVGRAMRSLCLVPSWNLRPKNLLGVVELEEADRPLTPNRQVTRVGSFYPVAEGVEARHWCMETVLLAR